MDVDVPLFDPTKFEVSFPFFESTILDYLKTFKEDALVGRDIQISRVNHIISIRNLDKYNPIICSTSRGMGKTAFLAAVGMQKVKAEMRNPLILDAIATGRILSFDFAKGPGVTAISTERDVETFFTRLMIYFLCQMFDGCQVDGIYFEKISQFSDILTFSGTQRNFRNWLKKTVQLAAEDMMDEYIRLTNFAFEVKCSVPPVFLLDEIQGLLKPTNVPSFFRAGKTVNHTFLSLLITQLAGNHKPVCICTGTNNGNIAKITEKSLFIPNFISLTTLHSKEEYELFWSRRTVYLNSISVKKIQITDKDQELFNALIYASYQIPRLMMMAHHTWFKFRTESRLTDLIAILQLYEDKAASYYSEMTGLFNSPDFKAEDIGHIIMCCGVRWKVENTTEKVPGTSIEWNQLIENSLVFPYVEGCYLFPFSLLWGAITPSTWEEGHYSTTRTEIKNICQENVPNLDIEKLHVSYDNLRKLDLVNLGIRYEQLFASSLATKYYLLSLVRNKKNFLFTEIYDFGDDKVNCNKLLGTRVDFSRGISHPDDEVFVNSDDLTASVIHNVKTRNAHHDIILPVLNSATKYKAIPVSCKASFNLSPTGVIERQLQVSKENGDKVNLLIWLYMGNMSRETYYENIVFMDGAGCCNGLAIDMFILTKNLISANNKS